MLLVSICTVVVLAAAVDGAATKREASDNEGKIMHGRATEEGRRTGIPASTLWVSAAGKCPRTQQHMGNLKCLLYSY
jgi:hypothetical protein